MKVSQINTLQDPGDFSPWTFWDPTSPSLGPFWSQPGTWDWNCLSEIVKKKSEFRSSKIYSGIMLFLQKDLRLI